MCAKGCGPGFGICIYSFLGVWGSLCILSLFRLHFCLWVQLIVYVRSVYGVGRVIVCCSCFPDVFGK